MVLRLHSFLVVLILSCIFSDAGSLQNHLAHRPPLGWMSWGYYQCGDKCDENPEKCLNEELIMSVADELSNNGYLDVGYEYVVVDDCWSEKIRNAYGMLVANRKRFPRGMKFLADYIHSRGLKFGLYGSAGATTCMGYPGIRGHLEQDAKSFAEWGVDYVKFDGCFVGEKELNTVYIQFGKALNKTGRPMVYSCSWPYYIEFIHHHMPDYDKVKEVCNLWRNYHDIFPFWSNVENIIGHYQREHHRMATYAGPGHWNDPDMILVGSGALSPSHSRVQMAVWAMMPAPLLVSCDFRRTQMWEKRLLTNPHLLSMNQDPLGLQAVPYELNEVLTLWVKKQIPMKSNKYFSYSLAFVNLGPIRKEAKIRLSEYGLNNPDGYTVVNVFEDGLPIANITAYQLFETTIPHNDVVLYTLFPQ